MRLNTLNCQFVCWYKIEFTDFLVTLFHEMPFWIRANITNDLASDFQESSKKKTPSSFNIHIKYEHFSPLAVRVDAVLRASIQWNHICDAYDEQNFAGNRSKGKEKKSRATLRRLVFQFSVFHDEHSITNSLSMVWNIMRFYCAAWKMLCCFWVIDYSQCYT